MAALPPLPLLPLLLSSPLAWHLHVCISVNGLERAEKTRHAAAEEALCVLCRCDASDVSITTASQCAGCSSRDTKNVQAFGKRCRAQVGAASY
jgi:hypothetical protein